MEIKLFRSSTVGIIGKNYKLLTDPWLTDGEYYGSWSHYPKYKIEDNLDELNSYNAIYISHIHPDHCSTETLKKLDKNIPIYISDYHSKFLKFKIERLGFKVWELSNGKRHNLSSDFNLTIYPADNCDPELCYKFNGCGKFEPDIKGSQQIDSLSVIDDGKFSILNVNDCPYDLAKHTISEKVLKDFSSPDVLLTGYGGAGPYPQCFENLSIDQKLIESKKKEKNFLKQALDFIKLTNPKYYLPFAGTYVLTGKLNILQNIRGVPSIDQAYNFLFKEVKKLGLKKEPKSIMLNTDQSYNFLKNKYSKEYKKINLKDFKNYQENYLKDIKLDYEDDELILEEVLFENANKAMQNYINKKQELNLDINSDIYIKTTKKFIKIFNDKDKIDFIDHNQIDDSKNYVIYDLDTKLLNRILKGPKYAHWNNAEIGSHIKFFRSPDIFERSLYYSMNFFHI
tara:strand:+ start:774 stop:2135 length:1362 start_codon:yes stop_codon:yes gene_type:complete